MTLQLTGANMNGSPELSLSGGRSTALAWSPFGGGAARTGNITSLPGFNGERQDPLSGVTHLGNGYRAYSPALRRFTCPDSESPFGVGGVNPYVYCDHDPVNQTDPSGHGPITWLIRKAITLGARLGIKFAEESSMSALTTAGMVETGTELATQWATGISQSIARAKGDAAAARKLGWASLATGLAGGLGLAEGDIQQTVKRLRGAMKLYPVSTMNSDLALSVDSKIILGGNMKNTDVLLNGLYTFEDSYKGGIRLNVVAHGEMVGEGSSLIVDGNFGVRHVDADELYQVLQSRYNLDDYNSIRTISCFSGNGGDSSFASKLHRLSGKIIKAYEGPVTGNFEPAALSDIFLQAERRGQYSGMKNIFDVKYEFKIRKTNPYKFYQSGYRQWLYKPVHFPPR